MSSWIPCFWPAPPDKGSKHRITDLSEFVKTPVWLFFCEPELGWWLDKFCVLPHEFLFRSPC